MANFRVNNNQFLNFHVEKSLSIHKYYAPLFQYTFNTRFALIRAMDELEEYEVMSCVYIRVYHIYQLIWDASIGEMLQCKSDSHNLHDRYAISVMKDKITVGSLPRKLSQMCSLFLR